ncbi:hypothetical protein AWENTII_011800 [Aspergillus wentii]
MVYRASPLDPDLFQLCERCKEYSCSQDECCEDRLGISSERSVLNGIWERLRNGTARYSLHDYMSLVQEYTKRNFSKQYEGDVLDAFTGITAALTHRSSMKSGTRDEFVAGIPLSKFFPLLFWIPRKTAVRRTSNDGQYLPTWSWAGWCGAVVYRELNNWNEDGGTIYSVLSDVELVQHTAQRPLLFETTNYHDGYCSVQGCRSKKPHSDRSAIGDLDPSGESLLRFNAKGVPADKFTNEKHEAHTDGISRYRDFRKILRRGRHCGALYGADRADLDNILSECKYILVGHCPDTKYKIDMWAGNEMHYQSSSWCGCVGYFLLIQDREDRAERVGMAIIHPEAWEEAGPTEEQVILG